MPERIAAGPAWPARSDAARPAAGRTPAATLGRVLPALQYASIRFEKLVEEVLLPAAETHASPLRVEVWRPQGRGASAEPAALPARERLARAERARREGRFAPVEPGWRWGPAWSTAWFRLRGDVPREWRGLPVEVEISTGTEALLWLDGQPHQGLDDNHRLAALLPRARGGERVDLLVEAACNLPLGISTFWWDHPEVRARWQEAAPGRLGACRLLVRERAAWELAQRVDVARKLLWTLPADDPRGQRLDAGLRRLSLAVDPAAPPRGQQAAALLRQVDGILRGAGGPAATSVTAIGHAHIDTAWLWPLRETRRKCLRTFASVLRLMERFPEFHFVCSQAQQWAWVEEEAPHLFKAMGARVREGRWEPQGGMWIEPDCHAPSGESLIRQMVHGVRWFRSRFGEAAPQRVLFLPDTFGFPATLPQLARQAGFDSFVTNKMSWCESNRFPHVTFLWRGLDGTELLTHLTPGHNYNSPVEPADLRTGERHLVEAGGVHSPEWLQPFGFGDGGGGPTEEQVERIRIAAACDGLPAASQGRMDEFCERLHDARRRRLRAGGADLPAWDGELYLELHRGTYTSQAWIKAANRAAEDRLRMVEALACGLGEGARVRPRLDAHWKTLLLNQFHDILPGSSIGEVYREAREQFQAMGEALEEELGGLLSRLAARVDPGKARRPCLLVNQASRPWSGVVDGPDGPRPAHGVPPLGVSVVDLSQPPAPPAVPVEARGGILRNEHLSCTIDAAGRIGRLVRLRDGRHAGTAPLCQLVLYRDRPRRWEAWDVDRDYREGAAPVEGRAAAIRTESRGPWRGEVHVDRPIGAASRLRLTYRLDAGSRRVDVLAEVEWHEDATFLRALFPCDVRARHWTSGIQLGCLERPCHANTSWEAARFEVPGHLWMDLSEPGFGVAILDDGKIGRSCHDSTLGLSLLRSPRFPDPQADRGTHRFRMSVLLHDGDWRRAGVDAQAEQLSRPPLLVEVPARPAGARTRAAAAARPAARRLDAGWAPVWLEVEGAAGVELTALLPSDEVPGASVLRLAETRGGRGHAVIGWNLPAGTVTPVDLLERPAALDGFRHDAASGVSVVELRPFQVVSLRAGPAAPRLSAGARSRRAHDGPPVRSRRGPRR